MSTLTGTSVLNRARWEGSGGPLPVILLLAPAAAAIGALAALAPRMTLIGVIGSCVVGLCLLRIDVALMVLVATAPLEAQFPAVAGIPVAKLAGALCFASLALDTLRSHRKLRLDRSHTVVLLILAIALLSTLQARDPGPALTTTLRYASFAGVYIVLSLVGDRMDLVRRVVWALSLASTASAVIALQNYLSAKTIFATLENANATDFAFILVTTLPLTFWLLGTRPILRPVVVLMIALMSTAAVLSLSRSAVVGSAVGLFFFVLTDRKRLPLVLGGGILAITAAVLVIHSNPARFQTALFYKSNIAETNVTTRLDAWHAAARLAAENPLLGIGPGNFQFYFNEATNRPPGTFNILVVHDAYLDIAAELGFIAAALFVLYLVLIFSRLTTVIRSRAGPRTYAQALRVSLVIASVASIFISQQYFLPFWLIGGLATALWRSQREPKLSPAGGPLPEFFAAPRPGNYDGPVERSGVDQRERRLKDEFAAARASQERNRMTEERLAEEERDLTARAKEVAATDAQLARARKELSKKEQDLARREVFLLEEEQRRSLSLEGRERDLKELAAQQEGERRDIERQIRELKDLAATIEAQKKDIKERQRDLRFYENQLDIRFQTLHRKEQKSRSHKPEGPYDGRSLPPGTGGDEPG